MLQGLLRPFIRASLIYFVLGFFIGVAMLMHPEYSGVLRYTHMHVNLIGAYGMLIFGVAYHVLPRFAGRMLFSERLGYVHFALINIGLIGLVILFPLQHVTGSAAVGIALKIAAVLELSAVLLFVYNIWRTVFSPEAEPRSGAKCKPPTIPMVNP
jgi:cbb3-type cytochrome oxidase subunit 1